MRANEGIQAMLVFNLQISMESTHTHNQSNWNYPFEAYFPIIMNSQLSTLSNCVQATIEMPSISLRLLRESNYTLVRLVGWVFLGLSFLRKFNAKFNNSYIHGWCALLSINLHAEVNICDVASATATASKSGSVRLRKFVLPKHY